MNLPWPEQTDVSTGSLQRIHTSSLIYQNNSLYRNLCPLASAARRKCWWSDTINLLGISSPTRDSIYNLQAAGSTYIRQTKSTLPPKLKVSDNTGYWYMINDLFFGGWYPIVLLRSGSCDTDPADLGAKKKSVCVEVRKVLVYSGSAHL